MSPSTSGPRFVVLGNPQNRRVAFFQEALAAGGLPAPHVMPYVDFLTGRQTLPETFRPGDILRIESPGENFDVERLLLYAGREDAEREGSPSLSQRQIDELEYDHGRVLYPRQWYLGFRRALRELQRQRAQAAPHACMNDPSDVEVLFDKPRCWRRMRDASVSVPDSPGPISGYEQLRMQMKDAGWERAFVKLSHGSSASGVVALYLGKRRQRAVTSLEIDRSAEDVRLYNSLQIRTYTDESEIAWIVDTLARESVHVEQWLPKASQDGRTLDLRVLVIGGRAAHFVVRTSRSPMTNLHLGNRRGCPERLLEHIGAERWNVAQRTCERAAACFPRTLSVGVDLAFTPGFRRHAVLEANAFGDLLPRVLHEGLDTYSAQVAAMLDRAA